MQTQQQSYVPQVPQQAQAYAPLMMPQVQQDQPQTYAQLVMQQPTQPVVATRPDTTFQQQNTSYAQPQAHDTNAPSGVLGRTGIKLCPAHQRAGGRCRMCEGGGCEWKQLYDPIGIANPNIKPIKTYGEVMTERFGLPQPRGDNNAQNNGNYRQNAQQPQQQQNQYQQTGNNAMPANGNNANYQQPQQQNVPLNAVQATGSGNGQGAPSQPTGCQ